MATMTMPSDLFEFLGRTADGMVAIDPDLTIVAWNEAAAELWGVPADQAVGKACWEVLNWDDRCGNSKCSPHCPSSEPAGDDEIVETCEVTGRRADGRLLWLSVTSIVPPPQMRDDCRIVHLMREVTLSPALQRVMEDRTEPPADTDAAERMRRLTAREREVLDLLCDGEDGTGIAERLYLSPATVRNHVQNILRKLEVHSRVEAVALALRARR